MTQPFGASGLDDDVLVLDSAHGDLSQCTTCRHLRSWVVTGTETSCAAFPGGIPAAVWLNGEDHRQFVAGDGGVRWASNGAAFPEWALPEPEQPEPEQPADDVFRTWLAGVAGRKFDPHQPRYPKGTPGGLGGEFMPITGLPALDKAPVSVENLFTSLEKHGLPSDLVMPVYESLDAYQGDDYKHINQALLKLKGPKLPDDIHPYVKKHVGNIDAAMDVSKLTHDVVVYRGERNPARNFAPGVWSPTGGMEGMEWTFPSYASTSVEADKAEKFALQSSTAYGPDHPSHSTAQATLLTILAPKGTKALSLQSHRQKEGELLLARGLRYRVVKDHGVSSTGPETGLLRRLDVEVVQ